MLPCRGKGVKYVIFEWVFLLVLHGGGVSGLVGEVRDEGCGQYWGGAGYQGRRVLLQPFKCGSHTKSNILLIHCEWHQQTLFTCKIAGLIKIPNIFIWVCLTQCTVSRIQNTALTTCPVWLWNYNFLFLSQNNKIKFKWPFWLNSNILTRSEQCHTGNLVCNFIFVNQLLFKIYHQC